MQYGTVVQFLPGKGFGFIRPDFGQDVFFHVSALGACQERPQIEVGQMVKYELASSRDRRGSTDSGDKNTAKTAEPLRPQAMLVELIDAMPSSEIFRGTGRKQPTVHHPRARRRKPTWRK